jgi:hypothetical protein
MRRPVITADISSFRALAWKNVTFAFGLGWLLYGAVKYGYRDWDIPLSLLMALSTYLTADRLVLAIFARQWRKVPLLAIGAWWAVDGSYWAYWSLVDPSVMIRGGQWPVSLILYLACGIGWAAVQPRPTVSARVATNLGAP